MKSQIETCADESRRNRKSNILNPSYAARYSLYAVFLCLLIAALCTSKSTFASSILGWGSQKVDSSSDLLYTDFVAIAAGGGHSLALKSDGSIIGWGWNFGGQASPPARNDFVAIAAGGYHSLALKSDGSIIGWGWNFDGQARL